MTKPRLISVDVGNGFTKAVSSTDTISFPSVVATEQATLDFEGFQVGEDFVIEFEGKRYALGKTTWKLARIRVTTMDRSRVGTPFYRILFAGALAAVVHQSATLSVVLSLPVQWYADRETVKEMMAGRYVVTTGGRTLTYQVEHELLRVVPEGFGTVVMLVIDKAGEIVDRELAERRIGVVDVGTKSTDFMYFDALEIFPAKSGGLETALADVWRAVGDDIAHHVGRNLELHEVDEAMHRGYLLHQGEQVDITAWRDRHLEALSDAISGEIRSLWSGGNDVDTLILTGGGAALVDPFLDWPRKRLVDGGHLANCAGAYRYGLLRAAEG